MGRLAKPAAAALALALALGMLAACSGNTDKTQKGTVGFYLTAAGWEASSSTPAIAHIESTDGRVETYHAVSPGDKSGMELAAGSFSVEIISPINADGSICKTDESLSLGVEANKASSVSSTLEPVSADCATAEQLEGIVVAVAIAVQTKGLRNPGLR